MKTLGEILEVIEQPHRFCVANITRWKSPDPIHEEFLDKINKKNGRKVFVTLPGWVVGDI